MLEHQWWSLAWRLSFNQLPSDPILHATTISWKSIRIARRLHRELLLEPFGVTEWLRELAHREASSVEEERPKAEPLAWAYREGNPG